jgi:hypothetical protein
MSTAILRHLSVGIRDPPVLLRALRLYTSPYNDGVFLVLELDLSF